MKKIIKMNSGNKYLSLGNIFYYIKKYCNNKEDILQSDIFCSLFDINYINNTTVNNYLIGIRAIGMEYKKIIKETIKKYEKNNLFCLKIVNSLISLLDNYVYVVSENSLYTINNNINLKKLCKKLIDLSSQDPNISNNYKDDFLNFYKCNNLYDCFLNMFFYSVLENKQPVFNDEIEIILDESLKEYLKIKILEGVNNISHMIELAKSDNVYANIEMGALEFSGQVSGAINYVNSYNYYLNATKYNNPKAFYMVAYLIINNKVKGNKELAWKNLNFAVKYGNVAALNTIGLCYLNGNNPYNILDEKKGLEYLKKSSSYGYSYAYNNLGKYYEKIDYEKSFEYYKCSADLNNSWALNKVGEYYRKCKNINDAFYYYKESSVCPISEICYYSFYNLAKYYYLVGNKDLKIKKDLNLAKEYFSIAFNNDIKEAYEELKKLEVILNDL